jgi:hypothetical protein
MFIGPIPQYRDIGGFVISPGDFIVYATLWGRSATLKFGRVRELKVLPDGQYLPGCYLAEPVLKISAVTVDRGWNGEWEVQKNGSPITLSFLDRLMVVSRNYLPPAALKLLLDNTPPEFGSLA